MKLRYFVLVTAVAAFAAACADTPTASTPATRNPSQAQLVEGDTVGRGGGAVGSGH